MPSNPTKFADAMTTPGTITEGENELEPKSNWG